MLLLKMRNQMNYVLQVPIYRETAETALPESSWSSSMSLQPPPPNVPSTQLKCQRQHLEPSPPTSPPHELLEPLHMPTATSPIRLLHLEHSQEPSPPTFPLRAGEST